MKEYWRRHKEKLWAPFEVLLLLTALLSPVIFSDNNTLKTKFLKSVFISTSFMEFNLEVKSRNIASTIVEIQKPEAMKLSSLIVSDRQVRFESSIENNWKVISLERKFSQSEDWEAIPLIQDKENHSEVSSFIELDPGKNIFKVMYENADGLKKEMPLVVDHIRKDIQD